MPEIRPFAGIRYAASHLSADVLAPPFDVIGERQRRTFADRSSHNIVLLDKGPEGHDDAWYEQAAALKDQWLVEGVLQMDASPAFYGYQQVFTLQGASYTRTGFIAAVRLAPWGQGIHPHERTRTGDRADRLKLTRAMRANMSPVFGLYRDPEGIVDPLLRVPSRPLLDRACVDDVEHTFWRIDDPLDVQRLQGYFAEEDIVIADGHHRYETALAYQAEMRDGETERALTRPYDYVMMYLTNTGAPGLIVLPTHRMVNLPQVDQESLLHKLGHTFEIFPLSDQSKLGDTLMAASSDSVSLAMVTQDMGVFVLRLKSGPHDTIHDEASDSSLLHGLDVVVLQERILGPLLGISHDTLAASTAVSYTTDAELALEAVRTRQAQLAFVLNATTTDQVWQAATRGLAMPQKSTFFHPKLLTGLVMNPLGIE
ncbi:MAG: DUF1015 domain-containing protein [Anaerolineae bacterium]